MQHPPASLRPNILLITSDQHRGDAYGFEGKGVHTPHLDLLARQGTRFSACITPNVVCQPSRASILTGVLPLTHGVHDNGIELSEQAASTGFAAMLSAAGYRTSFLGKAHFSTYHTFQPTTRPENIRGSALYGSDWTGPYMGFDHVEMMLMGHNYWLPARHPEGLHYERWYAQDGLADLKDNLYRAEKPPRADAPQTHHSQLPPAWHNSTWVGDRAVEMLREHKRQGDRPFCAWVSFPDPHHPFDAPDPWARLHRPEEIALPRHRTKDFDRRPWWHRAAMENAPATPGEFGRVRREFTRMETPSDRELREIIANYYGMLSLIDHNVGRILSVLDELDLSRDTLVIFTSDHGEWLGDHGLMLKGPMFYEGLLRVGMIARGPGVAASRVVDDPVSTLDLAATFADYAGVTAPAGWHSSTLSPLWRQDGAATHSRRFAYSEWKLGPARCGVTLDLRAARTRDAKLTLEMGTGVGELYVLGEDPDEMQNRFEDPSYKGLRDELEDMIRSRPSDEMDPLPTPIGPG